MQENGQEKAKILIVDDDREFCARVKDWGKDWFTMHAAYLPTEAMARLNHTKYDLILLDMGLPGELSGFEFLKILKVRSTSIPVIMLTGNSQHRSVVACMSVGASDYVIKGTDGFLEELQFRINQSLQKHRSENRALKIATKFSEELARHEMIGESSEVLILKSEITRQKGSPSTVLITGESGTGKELIARALHRQEPDVLMWLRCKGRTGEVKEGFKNGDEKTIPVSPDAYGLLKQLYGERTCDLVFHRNGKPLEYSFIQHAYDLASRKAKIDFSGTHVMRRTGASWILNQTGDIDLAKELLGNTTWSSVKPYAQRESKALTDFNNKLWSENSGDNPEPTRRKLRAIR
jgi:DNA-binding response OmpR family regulator